MLAIGPLTPEHSSSAKTFLPENNHLFYFYLLIIQQFYSHIP